MKRKIILMLIPIFMAAAVIYAGDRDSAAVDFVKVLANRAQGENGYINALRYFQYTATVYKNNPSSYILSKWGKDALAESGLKPSDKGKFLSVLSSRSDARIEKLWKENKPELFKLFPGTAYGEVLKDEVNSLIAFRTAPEYEGMMKKIKSRSPKPGVKTVDIAGDITGWSSYRQLSFWYRRVSEKNDKAVFEILKDLQSHYGK